MTRVILLAALATLALDGVLPALQDDHSLAVEEANAGGLLAGAGVPQLVERGDPIVYKNSDTVAVIMRDGTKRYVNYGVLVKNGIPCDQHDNHFANCRVGTPANAWKRGCSAVERCRAANEEST
ncbi:Putative rapid ALkalinization Factor [Septoria linicola]|uniref:Rapid ALkalinization Factor n=1 Tax=Septoria linicola TaxID=215465 RepID=A0A9Q9EKJ0_9PEZI|nr:Putative rapid ALkalinization Factor [Septoria linicola]